jgi:hypothetical protein
MASAPLLRRLCAPTLAGLVAALAPATGAAAPANGVHVIELASDFDHRAQAQALSGLLRLRLSDGGLVVASENPSLVQAASPLRSCDLKGFDPSVLRENADRGVDSRCQRAMAARLGTKRVVWGHLYTAQDGTLWAKVHLWQEGGAERVKALPYDAAGRERLAERLYLHLARPEEAADVRLTAPPEASGGELLVDGKALGAFAPGLELTVKAGEHAFEVRRDGKALAEAKAMAKAGTTTELALAAVFRPRTDIPIEFPDPPPHVVPPPAGGGWKRPAGFVGLGLGAALLGAGVVSSLRVRSLGDEFDAPPLYAYRSGLSGDACDAGTPSTQPGAATPERVDRLCSALSTFRVLQYVFYGAGALAAGAGVYLLVTAPSGQQPASTAAPRRVGTTWSVQPWVGSTSGGVRLGSSFLPLGETSAMRKQYRWQAGSALATTTALVALASALGPACDADTNGVSCEEAAARGRPCSGSGGSGGLGGGGASGTGGSPMNGASGAPMMGGGGAGGTGGGTCQLDPDCAPNGKGSLCVNKVCTAPTEGEACKRTTVVVVDQAFDGSLEGAPVDACYFRTLGEGLTAVAPGTTKRLAVYADAAQSATPIQLPAGVTIEGHHSQVGQLTALSAGAGGPALVSLGEGSGLRGFRLDGKGAKAVVALSGEVALSGPLELRNGAPALSVEGTAKATVTGSMAAPVLFTANARGVVVGATAALTMTGDGDGAGLVVEGTTAGAGVLVEPGSGSTAEISMTAALLRNNIIGDVANGTGAIEVRANRVAFLRDCVFEKNQRSVSLNGQDSADPDMFSNVTLERNDFSNALPTEINKGVALCGANFGARTSLTLGPGNIFPSSAVSDNQAACDALEIGQALGCDGAKDVGFTDLNKDFDLTCSGT